MHFVYILLSLKDKRLYIGSTGDIDRRIEEHSGGMVKSTMNRRPLVLLGFELYEDKKDAISQERYYKSGGKAHNTLKLNYKDLIDQYLSCK